MRVFILNLENFPRTLEDSIKADYSFFSNKNCEYYPCHSIEEMNCLFCFCPLYSMKDCGGNFKILDNGVKDCSNCNVPHDPEKGYTFVIERLFRGDKYV